MLDHNLPNWKNLDFQLLSITSTMLLKTSVKEFVVSSTSQSVAANLPPPSILFGVFTSVTFIKADQYHNWKRTKDYS